MRIQVGYVYKPSGDVERVLPGNGKVFSAEELGRYVEGYAEQLISGLKGCRQMFANEDGVRLNLKPNPHTWNVVNSHTYLINGYRPSWRIMGNIFAIVKEEV